MNEDTRCKRAPGLGVAKYEGSSNPLFRGAARSLRDGGVGQANRLFSNKRVHFSHGEFLQEKARFSAGDAWMMIASRGIGGAMIATYGAPILVQTIGRQGLVGLGQAAKYSFSLNGSFSSGAITSRIMTELAMQSIGTLGTGGGIEGLREIDVADVLLAASGMNFIGESILGAAVDFQPFSTDQSFSSIGYNKSGLDAGVELGVGLFGGGQEKLVMSINNNKANKIIAQTMSGIAEVLGEQIKKNNENE